MALATADWERPTALRCSARVRRDLGAVDKAGVAGTEGGDAEAMGAAGIGWSAGLGAGAADLTGEAETLRLFVVPMISVTRAERRFWEMAREAASRASNSSTKAIS